MIVNHGDERHSPWFKGSPEGGIRGERRCGEAVFRRGNGCAVDVHGFAASRTARRPAGRRQHYGAAGRQRLRRDLPCRRQPIGTACVSSKAAATASPSTALRTPRRAVDPDAQHLRRTGQPARVQRRRQRHAELGTTMLAAEQSGDGVCRSARVLGQKEPALSAGGFVRAGADDAGGNDASTRARVPSWPHRHRQYRV